VKVKKFQYQGTRNYQQDKIFVDENHGFFIVCDGVGGSEDGATASDIVTNTIADFLIKLDTKICVQDIKDSIAQAQIELNKYRKSNPTFGNSGTTLALLVLNGKSAYTAHMGDSKVLLFKRNSTKIWSTKDHSMVQELYEAGIIKKEEDMFSHPMKNRITNGLFARESDKQLSIPINELSKIEVGDIFIVASDGVFESYLPLELYTLFMQYSSNEATEKVERVVEKKSKDNSSFILIEI